MKRTLVFAALIASSPAYATDIMVVRMADNTIHTQPSAACQKLLRVFNQTGKMQLTLTNPPYTGNVIELHCVLPNGKVL